ncbi:mycoredoxin [Dehalogenimonas formicexedens]|uniref:Mycoredoxin n=1 Tax=Dehalogenimonas formicexedens TaxID=1839801 RepID=A0A1P8F8E6_9CHLR|nr:glutaredoxin domain-containing protein [Dehalogenimonas formicexedens]APV44710.1 mycoredoxin [Dehalogenimonas formicexedens]
MSEEIIMYGTTWCPDCYRAKSFLKSRGISFKWIDIAVDPAATTEVERINKGNRSVPTIVFPDGSILVEPSNSELEKKLQSGT